MLYSNIIKRLLDFLFALMGLILIFPIFILISIILFIDYKSSPFFYQLRAGKNGKEFKIYKFKSMNDAKDKEGNFLPDSNRITKIGGILRKTSLDEIPQLINVIKGEMSLIGPRPLYIKYLPYYTEEEKIRHTIRPGITGYAQVSGRNTLEWDSRLQKDIDYVKNLSFLLDIKIISKTINKVLFAKDIALEKDSGILDLDDHRMNQNKI